MPWRLLHNAQVLKGSQRGFSQPNTWISHKSHKPHKEGMGRAHKGLETSVFYWWHQHPQSREEESFYTCPPKTSRCELASKNQNIWFWSGNIWNLKYSNYSQNRTLLCSLVQWDVECVRPLCFTHLTWVFLAMLIIETLLAIFVVSLLIEWHTYTQD
jgi:hypothetical protein